AAFGQLWRSSAAKRSQANSASYRRKPRSSMPWSSSPASADSPIEIECNPAASGAMSGRAVSAPRTINANRASDGSSARPNNLSMVSKVQRSPSWLNSTFWISNGIAPLSRATSTTWSGSTNRTCAWGSRKRWMSQGQATRSSFGRRRVAQTLRRDAIELGLDDEGQAGFCPTFVAALKHAGIEPGGAQFRDRPLTHFVSGLAGDNDWLRLVDIFRPLRDVLCLAPDRTRQEMWRRFISIASAHIDDQRRVQRRNCVPEIFRFDRIASSQHGSPP